MAQFPATRCSYIAIFRVSLVNFEAVILCVPSQRVFIVVDFVIDSVRKLLDTPCTVLVGKPEGKGPLPIHTHR
jgi:hypothetical protein